MGKEYLKLLHLAGVTVFLTSATQGSPGTTCSSKGVILRAQSGRIQSPGYPEVYPGSHLCIWRIYPLRGRALYFTFKFFKLGWDQNACRHDNLTILDIFGNRAKSFCGNGDDVMAQDPIYIPSSGVDVIFKADGFFNGEQGFVLDFQAVACRALEISHGTGVRLEDNMVTIMCPGGTRAVFQCISDEWFPPPEFPLCPAEEDDLPIIKLAIIGAAALLLIILVIVLAIYFTKRWSRKRRASYERVSRQQGEPYDRASPSDTSTTKSNKYDETYIDGKEDDLLKDIEFENEIENTAPEKGVVICTCHESPYVVGIPPMKQDKKENDYVKTPVLPPKKVTYASPLEVRKAVKPVYDPRNPAGHYSAPSALKTRTLPTSTSCPQFDKTHTLPTATCKPHQKCNGEVKPLGNGDIKYDTLCNGDAHHENSITQKDDVNTDDHKITPEVRQNGQAPERHNRSPNTTSLKLPIECNTCHDKIEELPPEGKLLQYVGPFHHSCPDVCACIAK